MVRVVKVECRDVKGTKQVHMSFAKMSTLSSSVTLKMGAVNSSKANDADPITPQPPEGANPVDAALKHPTKDVLTFQKHNWLRNRYMWSLLFFVLVAAITTALVVAVPKAESNSARPIFLEFENEVVDVYEGHRSVLFVVNVIASSQPKLVWYGPNCTVLEEPDGPTRHAVYTSPSRTVTELRIYNISVADRGVYRLQASNKEGEEWAYFTLNVKVKTPLHRQHVVICCVEVSAHKRQVQAKFTVDNIDPMLCTHLVYQSATFNLYTNTIESVEPAYDLDHNKQRGAYWRMTSLKRDYPHLKVLLNIGARFEDVKKNFSEVAESPSRRKALVTSVSEFLRKYNFDGLDLLWFSRAKVGDDPPYKKNFVLLLKEFREEFNKFGLLLTAPFPVHQHEIEQSYDLPAISQHLHYMIALCYGYYVYQYWTRPHAPLYPYYDGDNYNVEACTDIMLRNGATRSKLVLGLALYGVIYKLKNTEGGIGFQKEIEGKGMPGPYNRDSVSWGYNEICREVDNPTKNWKKYWDNVTYTPYASKGDQFISYDDAKSITDKVELALRKQLAGVSVNNLDTDDFQGNCNFGSIDSTAYPLMRAISNALDNSVSWKKLCCPSSHLQQGQ